MRQWRSKKNTLKKFFAWASVMKHIDTNLAL